MALRAGHTATRMGAHSGTIVWQAATGAQRRPQARMRGSARTRQPPCQAWLRAHASLGRSAGHEKTVIALD